MEQIRDAKSRIEKLQHCKRLLRSAKQAELAAEEHAERAKRERAAAEEHAARAREVDPDVDDDTDRDSTRDREDIAAR